MINWEASLLHKETCHWSLASTSLLSMHFKHSLSSQNPSLNAVCKEYNPDGCRSWAAKKGSWNLRQGLSTIIAIFCHLSSEQGCNRASDSKVWGCWKNLACSCCLWACYPLADSVPSQPLLTEAEPFWEIAIAALCNTCVGTRLTRPAHVPQLSSWSWICNHTRTVAAFLLSRAESPWWQQCLQTPEEILKHFRFCSMKN